MNPSTISALGAESRNGDQHRQDAGDVRADDGQELADDAHPQRQRHRCGDAERLEHDPVEDGRQQRQQRPRVQVAAGLGDRQVPRPQDVRLVGGREPGEDRPPQPRTVGDEVVGEQQHREHLQHDAERGDGELDRLVLLAVDELLHGSVGIVELVDHALWVDRRC